MNIVYEGIDGSVAISTLTKDANVEDVVKKFRESHPGFYTKFTLHENLEVPKSREFRDNWVIKDGKIVEKKGR